MNRTFLLTAFLFSSFFLRAQLAVYNPSFEGTPQAGHVPSQWILCYGSPDTQPGQWGITMHPSNGSSYVSALQGGNCDYPCGYAEGLSQQLAAPLDSGVSYTFTIDLAHSNIYNTAEPKNCYSSLMLLGGNSPCDTNEILWQSGMITDTTWQTDTVTFTPTANHTYISFRPYFIDTCSGYINILMDNMSSSLIASASANRREIKEGITKVFPQPSSEYAIVNYSTSEKAKIKLELFNLTGDKVLSVYEGENEKGMHSFKISGNTSAGIYFLKLSVNHNQYFSKILF